MSKLKKMMKEYNQNSHTWSRQWQSTMKSIITYLMTLESKELNKLPCDKPANLKVLKQYENGLGLALAKRGLDFSTLTKSRIKQILHNKKEEIDSNPDFKVPTFTSNQKLKDKVNNWLKVLEINDLMIFNDTKKTAQNSSEILKSSIEKQLNKLKKERDQYLHINDNKELILTHIINEYEIQLSQCTSCDELIMLQHKVQKKGQTND